jgi:hypothetical protein
MDRAWSARRDFRKAWGEAWDPPEQAGRAEDLRIQNRVWKSTGEFQQERIQREAWAAGREEGSRKKPAESPGGA